ncbi:MAG: NADH-quinone oxidoreductase subunit C [Anaerolineales bacterium]|jgi:Ni,Fe-hydrogenase III large subunit/Ni,Fe-hydrogenase III component G
MSSHPIAERITRELGGKVAIEQVTEGIIFAAVPRDNLVEATQYVRDQLGGRFIISAGTDKRGLSGCYEVSDIFGLDRDKTFLLLRTEVEPTDPRIDSITPLIPGANWSEREVRDMIGVEPVGHPDPRRLVLPDDWPQDLYPLRKDFQYNRRPEPLPEAKPDLRRPPKDSSVLPIGPFFPTLEEPVFINLFVNGEQIVGMDYRGFFNHRGVEKMGEAALTYNQVPFLAERICGICGFVHSTGYCQAVEVAAQIQVPARARYLRSLLLEVERIHSHLLWVGLACHFIGFDTLFMQAWRIREPLMWLTEFITGNRKTYGMNLIGGVSRDLPEGAEARLVTVIDKIEKEATAAVDAILGDGSLRARLQRSGVLSPEQAKAFCVVGPTARGSGLALDARADHPYAAYGELDFQVCVEEGGDNWARTMVRLRELMESIKIVRQVLARMPKGPILAEVKDIPPNREGLSSVEAPRGEVHHYVLTGTGQQAYRWRLRAPSYANLQSIPAMLQGMTIADAPISIGSIDPCFSCTERVAVIDKQSGLTRVYGQEELLEQYRGRFA